MRDFRKKFQEVSCGQAIGIQLLKWISLMTTKTLIWIIRSRQWLRAYLRAELIERGFEAVGYADLGSAAAALGLSPRTRPRGIALESRDLAIEARLLDAIMRPGIPVILLVGAVEANDRVVKQYHWAAVMTRPIRIGAIADKVQEGLSR